ncbi:alpha/beta hydrolase [Streptomyces sp. NA02950]|uniref:alpha/beta fold hydrolase n=1 Tax=Streptomyces sp. NA02950 TaxID=2742137 RepID=UPI00158FBB9A|nr:alpha/beta hydrolase [Streptomyces sp. NA02950]QKV96678.1 alpha/beta hydrolase [Streptomyces sp. NA02950]
MNTHLSAEPTTGTLRVPGATLHYEVRGSGPVLLLIPGGSADAALFDAVAPVFTDRWTVVSYDPRGMSRSPLDGPLEDQRPERHSEDAYLLLEQVAPDGEPACVFGTSSGAIAALDLLARHPERLRRVVAHEPPVVELLPDAEHHRAFFAEVHSAYRREGVAAAMATMSAGTGGGDQESERRPPEDRPQSPPMDELPPHLAPVLGRMQANTPYFLEHILRQFTAHVPDVAALESVADRLVLAAGRDSRGQLLRRPAALLAERFGGEVVEFPGGHVGLAEHPAEFAEVLSATLG